MGEMESVRERVAKLEARMNNGERHTLTSALPVPSSGICEVGRPAPLSFFSVILIESEF